MAGSVLVSLFLDVLVEVGALDGSRDVAGADHEVTEVFTRIPLLRVALEDRGQQAADLVRVDVLAIQLVQALAGVATTQIEIVAVRTAADEADLRDEGTAATVRAAGHADGDRVVAEAGIL